MPGLSVFIQGKLGRYWDVYSCVQVGFKLCRQLLIFSSCIFFFPFLPSVSCHFLGYQFVLSHFQLTASNLLSALAKPENWASANCVRVLEGPGGLCGVCFPCSHPCSGLPRIATTEGCTSSGQEVYLLRTTCRSREVISSHSYVPVRQCLEYWCQQRATTTMHAVRAAGEEVWRSC